MPNVLLLCEYATLNGGEQSMLATLDGLRAAGWEPAVMAPPEGPLAVALRARGIEHRPFTLHGSDGVRLPQHRLRETLCGALRERRPDLLHANSLAMGRLSGPVAAELQLASVAHLRDIVRISAQAAADLNCHARLLAVSQAVREFHVAGGLARISHHAGQVDNHGGADIPVCQRNFHHNGRQECLPHRGEKCGLAAEKTHVLYNGIDLDNFRPVAATGYLHRELGLPDDAQLVGTIGQLGLRKGQDVLLDASQRTAAQLPKVHYLLVGERHSGKEESRRFERDLHAVGQGILAGRVHFLGHRDDVPELLRELVLLVHPARQEPLGRVLLEAAATGVAVIASAVGGTREIFPPEHDAARLVPPDDAGALAAAILELMGDGALRRRLGESARRRAVEAFDIRVTVRRLLEHYASVTRITHQV